jgi:DNA-binding HxlR family transcriptional regulator
MGPGNRDKVRGPREPSRPGELAMNTSTLIKKCVDWVACRRPRANIFTILNMAWLGQAVFVVTRVGIPRHLLDGPKTPAELARLTQTHQRTVEKMLRALAGFGILDRQPDGRYSLTPASQELAEDSSWLRAYVEVWGTQLYAAGGHMLDMARSGRVAYEAAHGHPLYEHYKRDAEAGRLFVDFMNCVTERQAKIVSEAIDFRPYRTMVDVGCGRAALATQILIKNPHLRATILDQPHMSESVMARLAENNLTHRCSFAGGSFLDSVPSGGDLYIIKHVLHDWADEEATAILRNIATAMSPTSRLIVVEGVLNDRNGCDRVVKMRDLEQMIWTGGAVRTEREFRSLFDEAGLALTRIDRTSLVDCCLISARKRV